ncbi:hypothetical protein [Flavobacterium kingsejongi]|uniref:Uncharacterized protein n=1 Tax=Flavobacterium kingsejongi TaxID=1678728 RepID=A0A2S1LK17_9FLAO|nr:hypothetical protein [Flavobacterium kingsejongi]AWG23876.1 hypothetical protein FK004_00880 [Flavobacterium kingsejongi]
MKQLLDLDTFSKTLSDKGYNSYFHTQSAYPGKLKGSISEYLEACSSGKEHLPKGDLILTGYLQWAGDERPSVQCNSWVKHENGTFDLSKMEVKKNDRFGNILKHSELLNLSVETAPKANEAISMVSETEKQKNPIGQRRFRL